MGKLRLDVHSSAVLDTYYNIGTYGIIDLVFNGVTLVSSKQLSANVETLEYDVEILTSANNVLKVALLNDKAIDNNGDGDYLDDGDQRMQAIITTLSYATDGVNYTTLLPQAEITYTVPSGPNSGKVVVLVPEAASFTSYGVNHQIEFNGDGLVTNAYIRGVRWKQLENGNYLHTNGDGIKDSEWADVN